MGSDHCCEEYSKAGYLEERDQRHIRKLIKFHSTLFIKGPQHALGLCYNGEQKY